MGDPEGHYISYLKDSQQGAYGRVKVRGGSLVFEVESSSKKLHPKKGEDEDEEKEEEQEGDDRR